MYFCAFLGEAKWANLYGVDLLNGQKGNSSLRKRGAQRYHSAKECRCRPNYSTNMFCFFLVYFTFQAFFGAAFPSCMVLRSLQRKTIRLSFIGIPTFLNAKSNLEQHSFLACMSWFVK